MAKQNKLTGRQIGILAILIEESVKNYPIFIIENSQSIEEAEQYDKALDEAEKALNKAINNCNELPRASAKILEEPIEMLYEYFGVL